MPPDPNLNPNPNPSPSPNPYLSPKQAFALLAKPRCHILVDLNGYTTDERAELLALKAAPVQLHAVGYAGTMGARFVPAMVIDRHANPEPNPLTPLTLTP